MITPTVKQSLEKQGYKLIGSHSGVKLCRWTKVSCSEDDLFVILEFLYGYLQYPYN